MHFQLIMYCANNHQETVCDFQSQFRMKSVAGVLVNMLKCQECGALFDEWQVVEKYDEELS